MATKNTMILIFNDTRRYGAHRCFIYQTVEEMYRILASVAKERLESGKVYSTDRVEYPDLFGSPLHGLSDAERVKWYLDRIESPDNRNGHGPMYYLARLAGFMKIRANDHSDERFWSVYPEEWSMAVAD